MHKVAPRARKAQPQAKAQSGDPPSGQRRTIKADERLQATRSHLKERLQADRLLKTRSQKDLTEFLRTLSRSEAPRLLDNPRYVSDGASVLEASTLAVRAGIEERVNKAVAVGGIAIDAKDADRLIKRGEITAEAMGKFLLPAGAQGVVLTRLNPLTTICRDHTDDNHCAELLTGDAGPEGENQHQHSDTDVKTTDAEEDASGAGDGAAPEPNQPVTLEALPLLIGNLVNDVAPPEDPTIFKIARRAQLEDVEKGVSGFELHAGPADTPSLHEFHHLRIAFEHVWQDLFDEDVAGMGQRLYEHLVDIGVYPNEQATGASSWASFVKYLMDLLNNLPNDTEDPPTEVISEFDITEAQWSKLKEILSHDSETLKVALKDLKVPTPPDNKFYASHELLKIAAEIRAARGQLVTALDALKTLDAQMQKIIGTSGALFNGMREAIRFRYEREINEHRKRGDRLIQYADHKLEAPDNWAHFHALLADLEKATKDPYLFKVFAANPDERSVNFGLITTYRQEWTPVSYQVGRLVKTVTLAPKEVRRFTKRMSVKTSRAEREVQNHMESRRAETSETSRAEREIIQKALRKTNFQLSAEGGVDVGIANAKGSTSMGQDATTESSEVKKDFREAVSKAAQDYKSERTTEVNLSLAEEFAAEESGETSNPNDEIPVTYIFYELQRRYRVQEQIHRLTPVVLVAQEFPRPDEIDDDWIVAHDWILRRVILDDSFLSAMGYLTTRIVGDEFALQEQYQNLQQLRRMIEDLRFELVESERQAGSRYGALQQSIEQRAEALKAEESEGFLQSGVEGLFGGDDVSPEALQAREDAARDAFERAERKAKEKRAELERETTSLAALTESYTKNLSDHLNQKAQIARLRVHLKQNITYYMQAIWSHEPPDQRFFRLHEVKVPRLQGKLSYTLEADPDAIPVPPDWKKPYKLVAKAKLATKQGYAALEEVADLDNLLGFKGNYMMFPLRESNVLTDFMMTPYLDPTFGVKDPDPLGNWTLQDFTRYVCCLHEHLTQDEFARLKPGLLEAYRTLLASPNANGIAIEVPTDSLFIEALPGAHPILEDFKLMHRAVDVKKAQAEARGIELENLRMAARLLAGEREDPSIEKKVVVEGDLMLAGDEE